MLGSRRGWGSLADRRGRHQNRAFPNSFFNFIRGNLPPAPPCLGAMIYSSTHSLNPSNSPKPPSNSLEFPSNSPPNSPSSTYKMLSPKGPGKMFTPVSGHDLQCSLSRLTLTEAHMKVFTIKYYIIAKLCVFYCIWERLAMLS